MGDNSFMPSTSSNQTDDRQQQEWLLVMAEGALRRARQEWRTYFDIQRPTGVNGTEGIMEADARLDLIAFVFERLADTHRRVVRCDPASPVFTNLMRFDLRVDTESFYWQAGRFRKLAKGLPGLASFEAAAVRDVRNHLIEHPEGRSSRVLISSLHWHPETGLSLKKARPEGYSQAFMDEGIFRNMAAFADELAGLLATACAGEKLT